MFYKWLRYCKLDQVISYFIVVLTVLLVSYQVTIVQITNAHHISAALMALIAIKLSTDAVFIEGVLNKRKLFFSFVMISVALLTYPPGAAIYWTLMAIYFFTSVKNIDRTVVKKIFLQALPFVFAMLVPILWGIRFGRDDRSTLDLNFKEKFEWFFNDIIPVSASYWDAFAPRYFLYISLAIILVALVVYIISHRKNLSKEFIIQSLVKIFFGFSFLAAAFCPMLLLVKYILPHRIFLAIDSLVLFYVAYSLSIIIASLKPSIMRDLIVKLVASITLITAIGTTNYNIGKYYVRHSNLTYNFLKYEISNIDWSNPRTKVHVVLSRIPYQADKYRVDEFGMTTTYWKNDVIPLIMAISNELNLKLDYKILYEQGVITVGTKDEIVTDIFKGQKVGKDRIIIDTNKIIIRPYEEMGNMSMI